MPHTHNNRLADVYERKADKAFYQGLLILIVGYLLATVWIYDGTENCRAMNSWFLSKAFCTVYSPLGGLISSFSIPVNQNITLVINELFFLNLSVETGKFIVFILLLNIPIVLFLMKMVQNRRFYNKAFDLRESAS